MLLLVTGLVLAMTSLLHLQYSPWLTWWMALGYLSVAIGLLREMATPDEGLLAPTLFGAGLGFLFACVSLQWHLQPNGHYLLHKGLGRTSSLLPFAESQQHLLFQVGLACAVFFVLALALLIPLFFREEEPEGAHSPTVGEVLVGGLFWGAFAGLAAAVGGGVGDSFFFAALVLFVCSPLGILYASVRTLLALLFGSVMGLFFSLSEGISFFQIGVAEVGKTSLSLLDPHLVSFTLPLSFAFWSGLFLREYARSSSPRQNFFFFLSLLLLVVVFSLTSRPPLI